MDKLRFLSDWAAVSKTELYQELLKKIEGQQRLFQLRCSNGNDETEWRQNQGRVDAYTKVLGILLHPEKLLDKGETTDTGLA